MDETAVHSKIRLSGNGTFQVSVGEFFDRIAADLSDKYQLSIPGMRLNDIILVSKDGDETPLINREDHILHGVRFEFTVDVVSPVEFEDIAK